MKLQDARRVRCGDTLRYKDGEEFTVTGITASDAYTEPALGSRRPLGYYPGKNLLFSDDVGPWRGYRNCELVRRTPENSSE